MCVLRVGGQDEREVEGGKEGGREGEALHIINNNHEEARDGHPFTPRKKYERERERVLLPYHLSVCKWSY